MVLFNEKKKTFKEIKSTAPGKTWLKTKQNSLIADIEEVLLI